MNKLRKGASMKAIQLFDKEDLRLVELPKPTIQADEILVRVKVAALCGTDVRMFGGRAAGATANHPLTLGHEFADYRKVGAQVEIYKVGMGSACSPTLAAVSVLVAWWTTASLQ